MLNTLCTKFLNSSTYENALDVIRYLRCNNMFHLGSQFGAYFNKLFPFSYEIKEEYGICLFYTKAYKLSYDIFTEALDFKGIDENTSKRILFNQHFNIDHVADRYTYYNTQMIQKIFNRKKNNIKLVTFTITTCKRLDLFQKTINSVINCFDIDLIDEWVCIDDNSSEEDRKKMLDLYPFFTFIFKNNTDKGHARSMNLLQKYIKTPYIFHMEDDWKFICKKNYISDCLDILNSNKNLGQCLVNKNYSEIEKDIDVKGGELKISNNGTRYYIHEFITNEEESRKWLIKHGNGLSSNYWPHFSLRPSLIRREVYEKIGKFNENANHFEMDYAHRYFNNGYLSAFLESIYSIHIGRLTSEKNDNTKINAYILNNEEQFVKKPLSPIQETIEIDVNDIDIKLKTYVLNLDRRPDRWENFKKNAKCIEYLNYERFSAIDGGKLKSTIQLQRIFDCNDYNMMVGAVGCAMSYFKMFTELIYSEFDAYLLLEDDIEFTHNFDIKFYSICKQLKNVEWDITFIGHHVRNLNDSKYKNSVFHIEKYDIYTSFLNSLGGTIGFMITKQGARKFLDFVNKNKLINCVDTALQKSANDLNVYYSIPNLVNSECVRHDIEKNIDTDIQYNKASLTKSLYEKIQDELTYFKENNIDIETLIEENIIEKIKNNIHFNALCVCDNIYNLLEICKNNNIKYYTYENKAVFIINTPNIERYYHIFKKNDIYNVDDCLVFN
jgi:GR25 family glycosyltransferase involved in LPS biosynthesis